MFASFAAVFVLMLAIMSPTDQPVRRARLRAPAQRSRPAETAAPEGGRTAVTDATRRASPAIAGRPLAAPPPTPTLTTPDAAEVADRAVLVARLAAQRLDEMEADLQRQVAALRQSRDRMLDDLAQELEAMVPRQAAKQVAVLDDEAGSLALSRLSARHRRAVLAELTPAQAARLRARLANTAAR